MKEAVEEESFTGDANGDEDDVGHSRTLNVRYTTTVPFSG